MNTPYLLPCDAMNCSQRMMDECVAQPVGPDWTGETARELYAQAMKTRVHVSGDHYRPLSSAETQKRHAVVMQTVVVDEWLD
jgi:hypothetical protein